MKDHRALKRCLDNLADSYGSAFIISDPVSLVHRYERTGDIEVSGFITAMLAYGGANIIIASARNALDRCGDSPADCARALTPASALRLFKGFKHRWTTGGDIAFLVWALGRAVEEHGSLGALARSLDDPAESDTGGLMTRLAAWFESRYSADFLDRGGRGDIRYLVPSPARGSACKRPAMFMRWMVRGPDGIDLGVWGDIGPHRLIIPVDRHIARMGSLLGLTARRSPDWKMALDITATLRELDPRDPLRYDFALVRPGIVGDCDGTPRGECEGCVLRDICLAAV